MLKGEKVTLRAPERDDVKRLYELEKNIDLYLLGHFYWEPVPLIAKEKKFEDDAQTAYDKTSFVIEVEGKVIGNCGLYHFDRFNQLSEMGISILDPEYLGKGYGRDAIRVLSRWAFEIQNLRRLYLETLASNERSIRAYKACGFVEEGRLREHNFYQGRFEDVLIMGLLRSEWERSVNSH